MYIFCIYDGRMPSTHGNPLPLVAGGGYFFARERRRQQQKKLSRRRSQMGRKGQPALCVAARERCFFRIYTIEGKSRCAGPTCGFLDFVTEIE